MKYFNIAVFFLYYSISSAQNIEFSPLSRFGFGDLNKSSNSIIQQLGKQSTGFASEDMLNFDNPASCGFLKFTDAEIGLESKLKYVDFANGGSVKDWSGNLSHIGIGIPLRNSINEVLDRKTYDYSMGVSLALKPFSKTGYNFKLVDSSAQFGEVSRSLNARGGLNMLTGGFGYRKKNFSIGLDVNYIFGTSKFDQFLAFNDIIFADNSLLKDEFSSNGFGFGIGIIQKQVINKSQIAKDKSIKEKKLHYGLKVQLPTTLNTNYNALHTTRSYFEDAGIYTLKDTVLFIDKDEQKTKLPLKINGGLYYDEQGKFGVSFDYGIEFWEKAKLHDKQKGVFKNSGSIGLGFWFRPDRTIYGSFIKRSQYRFGANYSNDYRTVNGVNPKTISLSAGMGIPFIYQRQNTMLNLGLEYGNMTFDNTLKENYIKLNLGFTINDNEWFLRRRYD
jgi:hypothetical protein